MSSIRLVNDSGDAEDIGDVDSHFYEKQVPPSGPFGSNAFALATARAKDRARKQLIKAVRQQDRDMRSKGLGLGIQGFELGALVVPRSIDGIDSAPDYEIKL